jgi:hypothetical protein
LSGLESDGGGGGGCNHCRVELWWLRWTVASSKVMHSTSIGGANLNFDFTVIVGVELEGYTKDHG